LGLSLSAQSVQYTYWFDDQLDVRITDSLTTTSHLQIEASHLPTGFHTMFMLLGSDSTVRLESFMFYITPPTLPPDSYNMNYAYWLDNDYDHRTEGTLANGQMLIDCNSLDYGFHSLTMMMGSGATTRLENFLFYKTPPTLPPDSYNMNYAYWLDNDYDHHTEGTLTNGQMLIDCDSLSEGFHVLYMRLGSGTTARLERHMFLVPPKSFAEYTDLAYWYEGENVLHHVSSLGGLHLLDVPEMVCGEQGKIHLMASDSLGNTSPLMTQEFVMMDSNCCLPPLFATADYVTESGARLHWDYNRPQTFTLVYDTVPINNPNVGHNRVTLTDTVYWFTNMPSGIICYYAIKSECGNRWTLGEWNTRCRTLTPLYAEACDSYTWQGTTYTSSVTLPEFIPATTGGCDSVTVMHITINHSTTGIETVSACDSYTWNGTTYTSSTNTPTFTSQNAAGCDSVTTLHLTISQSAITNEYVTACDSYTWQGTTYTASTIDSIATANAYGCDSIAILHLTINNSNTGIETVSACDSYTWHGSTYTSSTNTPSYTSTNAQGCDSITTLHLTINHSTSATETVTACDSYTWQGSTYTSSTNTPSYTSTNAQGCDSVTTLHLTINHSTSATENVTACDNYTWQGSTYTSSTNTPSYTSTNAQGCDSVTTLILTINYSTSATETVTACDSYTWQGSTYTSSTNTPSYTSTNAQGCDSVTTLYLTINYSTSATETVTACDSYTWQGSTYTSSTNTPSYTSTNAQGCDSITTLYLTINYSTRDTIVDSATGSYTWNCNTYTESGEYLFEGLTEAGCDSVVVLQLTITQLGINIAESDNITLYPNPTSGKLTIVADDIEKVEVFDQSGRIATTFKDTNDIDIHNLPTGAYTLRITLHNGSAVKRVIKQ